jgi:hypothetical protein
MADQVYPLPDSITALYPCIPVGMPPDVPEVDVPFLGYFKQARESLYRIPDPSGAICQLMNQVQLALAPARQFLELVENLMALKNCMESLPTAITQLSPQPVIDCLKKLINIIARILAYAPPLSYIKGYCAAAGVVVQVFNQLILLLQAIDRRITEFVTALADAVALDDAELTSTANCGSGELRFMVGNLCDMLLLLSPPLQMFLEPLQRMIPNPILQEAIKRLTDQTSVITDLKAQVASLSDVASIGPIITQIVVPMQVLRQAIAAAHDLVAPLVGLAPIGGVVWPSFVNF